MRPSPTTDRRNNGRLVSGSPADPVHRTEHYYYDGVRRIQTVDDNATPANSADDLTQHEYVYGPEYVDEFVLQSQRTVVGEQVVQKPFYMLQDANYNVMALLDDTGAVVEQYQWEPYGSLATLDTTASPRPDNSVGHQGLFFYRFDSGDTLSLNALGLYFNRNRWYSPSLGSFTSREPNCAGSLIIGEIWAHGHPLKLAVDPFDSRGHFEFGLNLYEYLGGNPPVRLDPLGTWFVGFSASLAADLGWTLGSMMAVDMFGGRSPNGWDILRGAAESAAIGTTYGYLLTEVPSVHTPGKNVSLMKGAPSSLDATLMGGVGTVLSFMTGMYAGVLDTMVFMVEYDLW